MPVSEVAILYVIALMMASALSCLAIVLPRPDSETGDHNGRLRLPFGLEDGKPNNHGHPYEHKQDDNFRKVHSLLRK